MYNKQLKKYKLYKVLLKKSLPDITTDFYWLLNLSLEESSVFVIFLFYITCDT